MPITQYNIVRHELIGLPVRVVEAKNKKNIGIRGKVVNETSKTLVIETEKGEKRIFKSHVVLHITLPNRKVVEVDGKLLAGRPWDRIKKKIRKW